MKMAEQLRMISWTPTPGSSEMGELKLATPRGIVTARDAFATHLSFNPEKSRATSEEITVTFVANFVDLTPHGAEEGDDARIAEILNSLDAVGQESHAAALRRLVDRAK